MFSRLLSACALCVLLAACSTVPQVAAYRCEDPDYARHRLIFHPNGRFAVQLIKVDEDGDVVSRSLYAGYYRKSFYAYDLKFDELTQEKIKNLFRGTIGVFVADGRVYRIEKITDNVFVGNCRMKRES